MKEQVKATRQLGLLREPQVLELIPISPATLWRMVKDRRFPKPVQISERAVGWRRQDVQDWIDSREEVGDEAE